MKVEANAILSAHVNLLLITTISLTLANPINIGIAMSTPEGGYDVEFQQVNLQTPDSNSDGVQDADGYTYLPGGGTVPTTGGGVYVPGKTEALEDSIALVGFYEGFFDQDADVTISVADEPREPGTNPFIDPLGNPSVVSPKARITFPYSALSTIIEESEKSEFILYVQAYDGEYKREYTPEGQGLTGYQYDIRISLDDGSEYAASAVYRPLEVAGLFLGELNLNELENKTSETVTITFQILKINLNSSTPETPSSFISSRLITTQGLESSSSRDLYEVSN